MASRHRIVVENAEALTAVHHPPIGPEDHGWIIFCHGFLSDKSGSYEGRCERAAVEGYHGVRFDFRGCGEADGQFANSTLSGRLADLRAVLAHFAPDRVALFGSSFGGAVAFHAAPDVQADLIAVLTRAPVTDLSSFDDRRAQVQKEGSIEVGDGRSIDDRFFEDLDSYAFADILDRLSTPVFIAHGSEDASVPMNHSIDAARDLDTDVLLEKFSGEGHRFSRAAEDRLRDRMFGFLATI
ncbi:MAG: alpha/beta hydrolase family protein [Salinirussus sp.]